MVEHRPFKAGVLGSSPSALTSLFFLIVTTAAANIGVVGEFSNTRFTREHEYGYTVQLWREGDTLFGLFLASQGLAGDTPAGVLEDVKFDPQTGKLSFKARLTTGIEFMAGGRKEPSRDVFEFQGVWKGTTIEGTLKHSDLVRPDLPPMVNRVRLLKQAASTMTEEQAREILKRLGPKW